MKIILITLLMLVINTNILANEVIKQTIKYDKETRLQAKYWQIEPQNYIKAQQLREQYKGLVSKDITPIEVLGIFANTKAERDKYARIFAKMIRQTTKKVLDFQKSVNQAHKDLYGADSMFDYQSSQLPTYTPKRKNITINIDDCNQSCITNAKKLINTSFINPVDFYFTSTTDDEIRSFARKLGISVEQVQNKQITLNHSN